MRTEPHQLVVVEPLTAEAQYEMIGPGLFYGVHRLWCELLCQVDTLDVSAERSTGRPHLDFPPLQYRCHCRLLR